MSEGTDRFQRGHGLPGNESTEPGAVPVLALVGRGMANKQIARALGIREGTVKAHLTGVFQRIGVRDRTSAALWARTHLPESRESGRLST
ncbi:MAG: two component transcriptional regulator, LuxR family [Modestobacter sp.]|nr:two component transcriptional regulator, LuxR family [Modestobacter sp.]